MHSLLKTMCSPSSLRWRTGQVDSHQRKLYLCLDRITWYEDQVIPGLELESKKWRNYFVIKWCVCFNQLTWFDQTAALIATGNSIGKDLILNTERSISNRTEFTIEIFHKNLHDFWRVKKTKTNSCQSPFIQSKLYSLWQE